MDGVSSMDIIESRLEAAGWRLPAPPVPRGNYAPYHLAPLNPGRLVCISGQASRIDGAPIIGVCRPGGDLTAARAACAQAALNGLAALRLACTGDLRRVQTVLQMRGYLRSEPDFEDHSAVLDGASQVLQTAFPEMLPPARSAIGVSSLPSRSWAEVELIALLREDG